MQTHGHRERDHRDGRLDTPRHSDGLMIPGVLEAMMQSSQARDLLTSGSGTGCALIALRAVCKGLRALATEHLGGRALLILPTHPDGEQGLGIGLGDSLCPPGAIPPADWVAALHAACVPSVASLTIRLGSRRHPQEDQLSQEYMESYMQAMDVYHSHKLRACAKLRISLRLFGSATAHHAGLCARALTRLPSLAGFRLDVMDINEHLYGYRSSPWPPGVLMPDMQMMDALASRASLLRTVSVPSWDCRWLPPGTHFPRLARLCVTAGTRDAALAGLKTVAPSLQYLRKAANPDVRAFCMHGGQTLAIRVGTGRQLLVEQARDAFEPFLVGNNSNSRRIRSLSFEGDVSRADCITGDRDCVTPPLQPFLLALHDSTAPVPMARKDVALQWDMPGYRYLMAAIDKDTSAQISSALDRAGVETLRLRGVLCRNSLLLLVSGLSSLRELHLSLPVGVFALSGALRDLGTLRRLVLPCIESSLIGADERAHVIISKHVTSLHLTDSCTWGVDCISKEPQLLDAAFPGLTQLRLDSHRFVLRLSQAPTWVPLLRRLTLLACDGGAHFEVNTTGFPLCQRDLGLFVGVEDASIRAVTAETALRYVPDLLAALPCVKNLALEVFHPCSEGMRNSLLGLVVAMAPPTLACLRIVVDMSDGCDSFSGSRSDLTPSILRAAMAAHGSCQLRKINLKVLKASEYASSKWELVSTDGSTHNDLMLVYS